MRDYENVLKAAGDPTRARILKLLEAGDLCVGDIVEVLGLSQSTVSGHLTLLKKAGLITDRRDGRWVYYALVNHKVNPYALPLLALMLGWLDDDPQVQSDKVLLDSIHKRRGQKDKP